MKIGKIIKECPHCKMPLGEEEIRKLYQDDIIDSSSITIACPHCNFKIQLWAMAKFHLIKK